MEIIRDIPPKLDKDTWVAIDTEWFGLNPHQIHRPTSGKFACATFCIDPETVYFVDQEQAVPSAMMNISDAIWIFQHAKFDLTHLRRLAHIPPRNKIWDTMLIEQVMFGGYYDLFGLEHLARRHLDIVLDKSLQKAWTGIEEITDEMLEYTISDVVTTLRVCQKQREIIRKSDFRIWKEIELPVLWAFLDFQGFRIDVDAWTALAERNQERSDEIDEILGFNPRSYKVVKEKLIEAGFKGLPSTGEDVLLDYINTFPEAEAAIIAKTVLEGRKYSKRASTYGFKFIEKYLEEDLIYKVQVIHCDYNIVGAETGRTSSSDPNMQNIPKRETPEFRECFLARPNHKLVIADYGQQETRIAAYLSRDKDLIAILKQIDKDPFVVIASLVFEIEIEKDDPRRRQIKDFTYGLAYGMSAQGFAERANISEEDAKRITEKFSFLFPAFAKWVEQQSKKRNYVTTVSGRRVYLNPYSGQSDRNAVNSPIQGTAAEMMKKALARLHREFEHLTFSDVPNEFHWSNFTFPVVAYVHDELVLDVPEDEAEKVAKLVQMCMVEEAEKMCPGIPFTADVIIADTWAEKD